MNNKTPLLISYLALIIILLTASQLDSLLQYAVIGIGLIVEVLILASLSKEKVWKVEAWYTLLIMGITSIYLLGNNYLTAISLTGLTVACIIGFFLVLLSKEEKAPVQVVEIEPEQKFVGNVNTNKFHEIDCFAMKKVNAPDVVIYDSEEEARNDGKNPCKICLRSLKA